MNLFSMKDEGDRDEGSKRRKTVNKKLSRKMRKLK